MTVAGEISITVDNRQIVPGDPGSWIPPYSEEATRVSVYADDPVRDEMDDWPVALVAGDGSQHVFWVADTDKVMHASPVGSLPDTVIVFTSPPAVVGFDVTERNGIFHMVVAAGPVQGELSPGEDVEWPNLDAQGTTLFYKRGMLAPDLPDTINCDESPGTWTDSICTWSGTIALCSDFVVLPCSTLVIEPGTTVLVADSADGDGVDPERVELTIRGRLVANGVSWAPDSAIAFRSARTPERSTIGDWYGIHLVGASARAKLRFTSISGSVRGIWDDPGVGDEQTPGACAVGDTIVPVGTLWVEDCRLAYNEVAGIRVEGDSSAATPDRVHIQGSRFLTNHVGLVLRHASADGTNGAYLIRDNEFRFNELCGLEILGRYARRVVVAGNLFQGIGADEFITDISDTTHTVGSGLWYDENENVTGPGDTLGVVGNTFFRIEGAGIKADLSAEQIVGQPKFKMSVGGDTTSVDTYRNLFVRVGTGIDLNFPVAMLVRGNEFLYYSTGVHSTNHRPDLGGGTLVPDPDSVAANYFYVMDGGEPEVDWPGPFEHHINTTVDSTKTFYAQGNYWSPVQTNGMGECIADTGEDPYYFVGYPIDLDGCRSTLPIIYPTLDKWNVMSEPMKRARGTHDARRAATPDRFYVAQSVPNPTRGSARIEFGVPQNGSLVEIVIYDVQGRRVRTLLFDQRDAGRHSVQWDGRDHERRPVASGVYFCRMKSGDFEDVKRLVIMR